MRARLVNAFIEGRIRSAQCVQHKCANYVGGIHQSLGCEKTQDSDGQHPLRPVDQRDCFLRFENHRLDLSETQSLSARDANAVVVKAFAFANQSQCKMGQWSQIPTRPYAAL